MPDCPPADDELEELLACAARLDEQPGPNQAESGSAGDGPGHHAGASGAAAAGDGAPVKGQVEAQQPAAVGSRDGPCPWLFNVTQERGAPVYYSLHRALHARR